MFARIVLICLTTFISVAPASATESTRWNVAVGLRTHNLVGDGYVGIPTVEAPLSDHRSGTGIGAELGYRFTQHIAARLVVEVYAHRGDVGSARTSVDVLSIRSFGTVDGFAYLRYGRQAITHDPIVDSANGIRYGSYIGNLGGVGIGARYRLTPRISIGADATYMYCRLHARVRDDPSDIHDALPEKRDGTTWNVTLLSVGYHW